MRKHTFLCFFLQLLLTYMLCSVLLVVSFAVLVSFHAKDGSFICRRSYLSFLVWLICCAFGNFVVFSANVIGGLHFRTTVFKAILTACRGDSREVPWEVAITGDRVLKFLPNTAALKNETQHRRSIWIFKTVSLTQHEIEDWLFFW